MGYDGHIIPIPVGQGGLVGTRNQGVIGPDKLIVARNLSYYGQTLQKEGGAAKYNASALAGTPQVIGGWDWWPTVAVQRSVVFTNSGDLLKDSGAGTYPVTLASGLTTTATTVPVFVEGGKEAAAQNRKLFVFSGDNQVQVLAADGATTAAIATPAADWAASFPRFGFVHEGRLWGGGNANDPHRLYYSLTTNHEDMTGAGSGSISVFPGEGERLVGAMSYKGVIIAWKFPVGVYVIDTTDPTISNWKVSRISSAVGGVSPLGAVQIDDDVVFLDPTANFHLLSAVQDFGKVSTSNLSRKDNFYSFMQDNINPSTLGLARAVYYDLRREAHFSLAGLGASTNTTRVVLDMNKEELRFRYSDRDVCQSLWLRKDANGTQRLVAGDDVGFVWLLDQTTKSKDGVGYSAAWQTPYMDFSWVDPVLATKRKIGQFLEVLVAPTGQWNLTVDVMWDGVTVQTVQFNMGVTGAILGAFVLGTDKLAGDQILNRKRRIVGSGRRLALAGVNAGAGEDFAISHFLLHCKIGDERLGRDAA